MQLGEYLMATASASSPLIGETMRRHGNGTVGDFLGSITASAEPALQGRADLWAAVAAEAAPLVGMENAARVAAELEMDPIVPTSNHFGIETVAESVQSTVLFALRPGRPAGARYVVVFGFGSISMNNWSYPMGLRLYDARHGRLDQLPQRLPLFPGRVKQRAVCTVGALDEPMVRRARERLQRMARGGEVTAFAAGAAEAVLAQVCGSPATLALPDYAAQSPVVNRELWRRMFRSDGRGAQGERGGHSELVQLQTERVCGRLLRHDLDTPGSLVHRLFFDAAVRDRLLAGLDGARACWQLDQLAGASGGAPPGGQRRGGTVFFWGISPAGNRIHLGLRHGGRTPALAGVDEHGLPFEVEFTPDGLAAGLDAGRLLPSLFTCFTVLAFARGLSCVGGYYQAEYLPVMQAGITGALAGSAEHREAAELVGRVPTRLCLAGMQGLVREIGGGAVLPAGPVELAGMGGIGEPELAALLAMPVPDAYLVAFTELYDVLVPGAELPTGWIGQLAVENGRRRDLAAAHL